MTTIYTVAGGSAHTSLEKAKKEARELAKDDVIDIEVCAQELCAKPSVALILEIINSGGGRWATNIRTVYTAKAGQK